MVKTYTPKIRVEAHKLTDGVVIQGRGKVRGGGRGKGQREETRKLRKLGIS